MVFFKNIISVGFVFTLAIVMGVCQSCDKMNDARDGAIPLEFKAGLSAVELTKASVEGAFGGFGVGEYDLGLFIGSGHGNDFVPQTDGYQNLRANYVVTAKDNTSYNYNWTFFVYGGEYYPISVKKNLDVSIIAYYPWDETVSNLEAIPFVSSNANDWMVSNEVNYTKDYLSGLQNELLTIPLEFRHLMTCIEVAVTCKRASSIYLTDLAIHDSESSLVQEGLINAYDGTVTPQKIGDVIETEFNTGQYLSPSVIQCYQLIFPAVENVTSERFILTFRFDNHPAASEFRLPVTFSGNTINSFEAGKKYRYRLVLDNIITFEGVTVETDWENEYVEDVEL